MARRIIAEAEIRVAANTGPAEQDFEELTRAVRQVGNVAAAAAKKTEDAFRDVGRAIDLALAGGLDGLQTDIRRTIRQLDQMGGAFREVGVIAETALNDALDGMSADADRATLSLLRLQRQLHDVAQSGRVADRSLDNIGNVSRRITGHVSGLVSVLGAAGLGYAAFSAAQAGINMTRQLEKSEAMFLGLTGSVEGAADMLERMVMFARETPYNLASVSEAAAQLLAVGDDFGVTTANIEKYLTTFGDAITMTGGSEDQFIRIVRVLGQMSSTGKVLGQDMNQLAQNLPGYDVWQTLADGAGTSVTELRRLQDLGQLDNLLSGNEAVEILIEGMQGIPGAAGAMERRMNTLGGAIEKFTETAEFAMVQGLEPFSETLQDTLSDPVTLNAVEDLSFAFGDLLSKALQEVRPEMDDLAAAGENLLLAFEDWTPVFVQAVDALGDFINFVSPFISTIGKMTEAVLGFGDGLGKMGVAAGLAATGNPFGIAAGAVLAVSGALDFFTESNEEAANMARLLAAAQGEVNTAMAVGEEVVYSEGQQAAINAANELRDSYGELFNTLQAYGVTVGEFNQGLAALSSGTGTVSSSFAEMYEAIHNPDVTTQALGQFRELYGEYLAGTDVITEETSKQADAVEVAGVAEIGMLEERAAAQEQYNADVVKWWEENGQAYANGMQSIAEANDEWGELDADRSEAMSDLLQQQADAYAEWAADIDGSAQDAGLSLSDVADEAENSARRMIDAINENNASVYAWQDNIVAAGVSIQDALGLTDEQAQEFMGTLGEMGPAAAPALQEMLDDFANGGTLLQEFFNSTSTEAAVMSRSLTGEFDKVTGAAPGLAEGLAEGVLTIDQVLAELPAAMEAAGIDFETAASMIDASDEMGAVGTEAVNGLINALSSPAARARLNAAARSLATGVTQTFANTWQVQSPSRVMYEIGEFVVEGLIGGIQSLDDEAYATAVQTASMMSGGIADHFRDAEDPQEEARKFAEDVAQTIIDELIAEQEAVADAAEALAEAAADRLAEAWDRVKDRFLNRDIAEGIAEAQADLAEARAELAAAESLVGAGGVAARNAAEARVARAEAALAAAEATDAAADLLADQVLRDFQRSTEDAIAALQKQQEGEVAAIQARIDAAKRNLDPVARAAAEAELAAAKERHEAEMTALERQRDDEEEVLRLRLDNENKVREAAVQAKEDELDAFRDALGDIVDSIQDAIENLPDLRAAIGESERDLQDAYFKQFEELLERVSSVDRNLLASVGASAGLTATEVNDLINAAIAVESATAGATAASLGLDQLLDVLSTGLYTIGSNGALGIAAGLSDTSYAIAQAMWASVQTAINATLAQLEIRSPSRVTGRLIGEPMAEGIASGLMAAEGAVSSAMTGLLDNVVGGVRIPSSSQLVDGGSSSAQAMSMYRGPLVTMPGAIIQDATDADLVAQRVVVALAATGVDA